MKKAVILLSILATVFLFVSLRFMMTLPSKGAGVSGYSPDEQQSAWVFEGRDAPFWGAEEHCSIVEICDQNGPIRQVLYRHPDRSYDWYNEGKVVWDSESTVSFLCNGSLSSEWM